MIAQLQTGGLPVSSMQLTLDSDFMTLPTSCRAGDGHAQRRERELHAHRLRQGAVQPHGRSRARDDRSAPSRAARRSRSSSPTATRTCAAPTSCCPSARRSRPGVPTASWPAPRRSSTPPTARPRRRSARSASPRRCSRRSPARSSSATNFRLYIVVAGSGVLVKLAGDVRLDPATGQISDGVRQPAAGPVHDVRVQLPGRPASGAVEPDHVRREDRRRDCSRPWSGTAPKTRDGHVHDRPGLHRGGLRARAAGHRGLAPRPAARPAR